MNTKPDLGQRIASCGMWGCLAFLLFIALIVLTVISASYPIGEVDVDMLIY